LARDGVSVVWGRRRREGWRKGERKGVIGIVVVSLVLAFGLAWIVNK
jgi:phosphoribosyl-AMP cyclohydrolase